MNLVCLLIFVFVDKIVITLLRFRLLLLNFVQPHRLVPTAPTANSVAAWLANANPSSSSQSPAAAATSLLPGPSNAGTSWSHFSRIKFNMIQCTIDVK